MQENTKKLIQKNLEGFLPVATSLAEHGKTPEEIAEIFQDQQKIKQLQFYANSRKIKSIKEIFRDIFPNPSGGEEVATSKAEWIFGTDLKKDGFEFWYQYKIGPYTVDFLFDEFLVVEIDGPQHSKKHDEKRDRYMKKLGYEILRIPLSLLCNSPKLAKEMISEKLKNKSF